MFLDRRAQHKVIPIKNGIRVFFVCVKGCVWEGKRVVKLVKMMSNFRE